MGTFLTWLNSDSVYNQKSRFVFAMVNDPKVLERVNDQTTGALFRDGRFGKRVHVGGCDDKQFGEMCDFIFPDVDKDDNELYHKILRLCEKHKDDFVAPLTVQRVQSLILRVDFDFDMFLQSAFDFFENQNENDDTTKINENN